MSEDRYRTLGTIRFSAGQLAGKHGVTMTLEDGRGIGWVLCGELDVDPIGRVGFECPWDPSYETALVYVPVRAPAEAITLILAALELTSDDVLQLD